VKAVTESLKTLIAANTGLPSSAVRLTFRLPLQYQSNRPHDVWAGERHLILKEFLKPEEFQTALVREYWALELMSSLDIAPQPVFLETSPPAPIGSVVVYASMEAQMKSLAGVSFYSK
jgi:hypothetical protein